jgi:putative ABC transport system permease protein
MGSTTVVIGPAMAVAGVLAVALAATLAGLARLGTGRPSVVAGARAVVQLGAVSLLIGAIVGSVLLSTAFVLVMVAVAAFTSARRITPHRSGWWAVLPIAVAPLPVTAMLVLTGVVPPVGVAVIPWPAS